MSRNRFRYGKASVSWGKPPYGSEQIIANAPIDAWDDLLDAVRIARDLTRGFVGR
jgi:hypothetical protein